MACYTSCEAIAGMRNSVMGPPLGIDLTTHHTTELRLASKLKRISLFNNVLSTFLN